MSQKLIVPFKKSMIICGYKTQKYLKEWGYQHYGIDISTIQGKREKDHVIRASGEGTVIAVGHDGTLGYGVAITYPDCVNHRTGKVQDLTARYMHMSKVYVKPGQKVSLGDPIADEGKEGTSDYHLHIEFDTDARAKYATYSPQVSAGHRFWIKGIDSTVNPTDVLYRTRGFDLSRPLWPDWCNAADMSLPITETPEKPENDEAEELLKELEKIVERLKNVI